MHLRLEIPGDPIAWKRPADKTVGRKHWRFDSQKKEKELVRLHMLTQLKKYAHQDCLFGDRETHDVRMTFFLPINQSDPVGHANAKLWGFQPANEKPDCDNMAKFYLDCGNGLLWSDDKRIRLLLARKAYSENPRTIIEIMSKNNLNEIPNIEGVLKVFGPNKLKEFASHVQALNYLDERKINECLEGSQGGHEARQRWLAWTALHLSKLAQSHANDLIKILKFTEVEEEIKQLNIEVPNG